MKYAELIKQMTLEEKASLTSGKNFWESQDVERLKIPGMFLSDGPHGVRKQAAAADHLGLNGSIPATCFPTAATVANSWNEVLAEEVGAALGKEAAAMGVNVLLGPGCNMKRNPRCGRNFEYFSEDPYLAGKLAAGYIRGIQSQGVSACVKHFAANNQEERRMVIDTVVDERTLREIYLTAFEIAVKEGKTKAIMSSYNKINGTHTNENKHLLKDILRDEWGFDGVVVTDWGGNNNRVEALRCGNELEMPTTLGDTDAEIVAAVQSGSLPEEVLDRCVNRYLELVFSTRIPEERAVQSFDSQAHHELAAKAAEESVILLKNEDSILPVAKGKKVAVIGDFAATPRYQGAGSSIVNPTKLDNTVDLIPQTELEYVGYGQGYERYGKKNRTLEQQAMELASKADVVLYYMGLDEVREAEGLDRQDLKLPENQIALLGGLYQVNPNIVVVLSCGSAVEMPWLPMAKGLLHGYLSGQAGAGAVLNIISGRVNPSGKLAETYPLTYGDVPSAPHFPGKEVSVEYREGLYIGYRYYSTAKVPVRFPFGFGLSYTTFAYSGLQIQEKEISFTITNTGNKAGAETAQLYVGKDSETIFRPDRELKGFTKVFLEAGESRLVTIALDDKAFHYYNIKTKQWETEGGSYRIQIGASCEDIKLSQEITLEGSGAENPYDKAVLASYYGAAVQKATVKEFEVLLGHSVPNPKWDRKQPLGYNDTLAQMQYARGWIARLGYHLLSGSCKLLKAFGKRKLVNVYEMVIFHQPFRGLARQTGGVFSIGMVDALLIAVNGNFIKGMIQLRKASKQRQNTMKYRQLHGKERRLR